MSKNWIGVVLLLNNVNLWDKKRRSVYKHRKGENIPTGIGKGNKGGISKEIVIIH